MFYFRPGGWATARGGGCVRGRCARRVAAAAAALLLPALLLLLLPPRAPPGAPRPTQEPPPPTPTLIDASPQLYNSVSLVDEAQPVAEWMSNDDDEVMPAGVARVRERYVAGHARAHADLCPAQGARLRLVVLVASVPEHARQRMAVRLTWGHAARRSDVALGFVLGAKPPAMRAVLDAEDALYADLIEGHYVDSYGNLTLKTLSMLEWFVRYCPRAARLLKSDDDMFINVEGLLRFADAPQRRRATRTVWGKVWRAGQLARNASSKFFVPREEFPGDVYPPYVNGPAYLVSGDAVGVLLRAALASRWLRMEDALVTGVAAARARVALVDAPAFLRRSRQVAGACALQAALVVHEVTYHQQFDLWRILHDRAAKC